MPAQRKAVPSIKHSGEVLDLAVCSVEMQKCLIAYPKAAHFLTSAICPGGKSSTSCAGMCGASHACTAGTRSYPPSSTFLGAHATWSLLPHLCHGIHLNSSECVKVMHLPCNVYLGLLLNLKVCMCKERCYQCQRFLVPKLYRQCARLLHV